jgi:perosamine synthetase
MLNPHPSLCLADLRPLRYRDPARWLWSRHRVLTCYNARAALYQLCHALPRERSRCILLPAFHCISIVEAVLRAGFTPLYYRIRPDLTIDYEDLIAKSRRGVAAVLVIHYGGFPADLEPLLAEKRSGAEWLLIEDCAHSFVDASTGELTGGQGEFAIFSFYKLLPMHVGGGIRINVDGFAFHAADRPLGFKEGLILAKRLVEEVIDNAPESFISRVYTGLERMRVQRRLRRLGTVSTQPAEPLAVGSSSAGAVDLHPFSQELAVTRLPLMSRRIMGMSDLRAMIDSRRNNYQIWVDELDEQHSIHKIYPRIPANVCPWAFPVRMRERSLWDHRLRARNVPLFTFGETLHRTVYESDMATVRDAVTLSNEVLMLGVHQGLAADKVRAAAQLINQCLHNQSMGDDVVSGTRAVLRGSA